MANLPESASFDAGIYQIETTDAVIGGVNGISNLQAKALANRTTWLKQQVDALNLLKGKGIAAFSAANSYAGGDQVIYQKNIWQANTAISPGAFNPANWTRQLGGAAEVELSTTAGAALGTAAVGVSTTLARADHVHLNPTLDFLSNVTITSIANGEILRWNGADWINNTLAEAGIAPVASPTFTGTPTVPTAAVGTNTTQAASTAFVKAEIAADTSHVLTANLATQAEAEAGTNNTKWVTPLRVFQAIAKVVVQATETVFGWAKVATQAQTDAGTDDATIVTPKKLRFGFSISIGVNSYIVFPTWLGGFIFQFGYVMAGASSSGAVGYPIAFPTAARGGHITSHYMTGDNAPFVFKQAASSTNALSASNIGFDWATTNTSRTLSFTWFVWGN